MARRPGSVTKRAPLGRPPDGVTLRQAGREDDGPALTDLLERAFPGMFEGRTFFKQQPHGRLLAFSGTRLVGHVAYDLRVITVGGAPFEILGIIDLCVASDKRGTGIGSALMRAVLKSGQGRDFAVLCTENPEFYRTLGFTNVSPAPTRWFAIESLQSHSVIERDLSDCLMIKPLGRRVWPAGKIDLLGYLF